MKIKLFIVDAFTNKPFRGNPAAVCFLENPKSETWMQNVAAEMNLSETAFLVKKKDGFGLRWFTPTVEVDLCGHATLASAHVLWEEKIVSQNKEIKFYTKSGLLTASFGTDQYPVIARSVTTKQSRSGSPRPSGPRDDMSNWVTLDFPSTPEKPAKAPSNLLKALGLKKVSYIGKSIFDYLVEVDSEKTVRHLKPDFKLLATIPARGVVVTSLATLKGYDFVSRFFGPRSGIDEDPVTGSAHCTLGTYWKKKLNKNNFLAYQASQRGGTVQVSVLNHRTLLAGQAVTVFRGELK